MCDSALKAHEYDSDAIAVCIEADTLIGADIKIQLMEELRCMLPSIQPFNKALEWLQSNSIINFFSLLFLMISFSDNGLDLQLTIDYKDWSATIEPYKCRYFYSTGNSF